VVETSFIFARMFYREHLQPKKKIKEALSQALNYYFALSPVKKW